MSPVTKTTGKQILVVDRCVPRHFGRPWSTSERGTSVPLAARTGRASACCKPCLSADPSSSRTAIGSRSRPEWTNVAFRPCERGGERFHRLGLRDAEQGGLRAVESDDIPRWWARTAYRRYRRCPASHRTWRAAHGRSFPERRRPVHRSRRRAAPAPAVPAALRRPAPRRHRAACPRRRGQGESRARSRGSCGCDRACRRD